MGWTRVRLVRLCRLSRMTDYEYVLSVRESWVVHANRHSYPLFVFYNVFVER